MRIRLVKMGLACAALATLIVAPVAAPAQALPEDILVDINLKDADMVEATRMLTKQTGLQFVIEPSEDPFPRITLGLLQRPAKEVLQYICTSAGASWRRDPNGVYIISKLAKGVKEYVPPPVDPVVVKQPLTVKKFTVLKGNANEILHRIMNRPWNPLKGYSDLNDFGRLMAPQTTRFIGGEPVLNVAEKPTQFQPMVPIQNNAESGASIMLPGESARGQAGFGGPGGQGGFGGPGGGLGGQGGGGLGGQGGGGLGGGLGGQGTLRGGDGLVGQSIDFITYDPTDNSLVVRGNEEDIANLQRYIQMFDVAPKQVVVKVEFITTSSSFSRSLGFDWLYERGTVFAGVRPGSFARAGDPIFLNYATGNVTSRMRSLLSNGRGKVVQAPIIRTLNNQPASVLSQVQTSIFISQVVSVGNGQIITVPQLVNFTITTGLSVAPRINDDGYITMFINVPVQDFGQLRTGPNGEQVPDLLSQTISVVARVKNGETIALGGLTRKSDQGTEQKFPILGDLPIIGQFFRSTTGERNNTELLIFVTPTVIDDDAGGIG